MQSFAIVYLVLVSFVGWVNCGCSYTSSDGLWTYDLSYITHPAGYVDLSYTDIVDNTFFVNVCGTTTAACTNNQAVCQLASNKKYYGCGALVTQRFTDYPGDPSKGVTIYYGNGTVCGGLGAARNSTVILACDPQLTNESAVIDNVVEDYCSYTIYMRSQFACPNSQYYCPDSKTVKGGLAETNAITFWDVLPKGCWEDVRGMWYDVTPSDDYDTIVTYVCSDSPVDVNLVEVTCKNGMYESSICYDNDQKDFAFDWCTRKYGYTAKYDVTDGQKYYILIGTKEEETLIGYDVDIFTEETANKFTSAAIIVIVILAVLTGIFFISTVALAVIMCVQRRRAGYTAMASQ